MTIGAGGHAHHGALAVVAGLLHAASTAWPFAWGLERGQAYWWMQMLAVLLFAFTLHAARGAWRAAGLGWAFWATNLAASLYWLHMAMHTYGGLPWALSVAAVGALSGALALYGLAMGWLWAGLRGRGVGWDSAVFAALFLATELARGQWLTGFGWAGAGYAHVQGPLAAWLALGGAYAAGALAAGLGMALAAQRGAGGVSPVQRVRPLALWLLVALMAWVWRADLQEGAPVRVDLLQGDIPQSEKFEPSTGVQLALDWYGQEIARSSAPVVIAPETAVPVLPSQLPQAYLAELDGRLREQGRSALVGIPMGSYSEGYTNSVLALGEAGAYRYDKHHLVPFGEFIPAFFQWFMRLMHIPLGDFQSGALAQPSVLAHGVRWGPAVCFEDVFSEELAARFVDPQQAPQVLLNLSNLAWFGDSTAPYQHLNIARVRSQELGRPTVRVANTGITAVVNAQGVVEQRLPSFTRGVLQAEVRPVDGTTVYAWWAGRWGQWPLWIGAVLVCALAARRGRGPGT
ncbi:MAG: apolipoprotein N-acyltransferase [Rhodoferax sp.]